MPAEEEDHNSSDGDSEDKKGPKRRVARPKAKSTVPRKRSKKVDEPVTVTISSDEDEPSSTSNMFPGLTPSPSPSTGGESSIFSSAHIRPVQAFGRFRRMRMEDEDGNSKLGTKIKQHQSLPQGAAGEEGLDEEEYDEDAENPVVYEIDARSVRIGSMRTQPEVPMLLSIQGVCLRCRSERTDEEFELEIQCKDVEHVKYYAKQPQPVLFLFLSLEAGEKLRSICHMEPGDEEYFDPGSTDMKQKMLVVIVESWCEMPESMLRETLSLWADVNQQDDTDYIEELVEETANDLLIQSAPPVLAVNMEKDMIKFKKIYNYNGEDVQPRLPGSPGDNADNEPDSTSSSPPTTINHFYGPPIRLLLYPPPPARSISITTEDLMCLAEGEFLNDVVIDFYLQYLYKEKLSEENQKRTHIFSSFFYKRLTQRDRHSERSEENANKSLPERRHARVKKWTKTVDLFSKDFIIVPINEHAHWYLAVICFPGLANPEIVPFIPSTLQRGEVDTKEDGANEDGTKPETSTSQEKGKKQTVFGQHLTGNEDVSDDMKLIGQKQPCILVFDSLAGPSRNTNLRMLREYLQCEWDAKKSEPRQIAKIVRGSTPNVPQQTNFSDCGVFLLQYVESFFDDPIADFQIPMKGLKHWFPEELVGDKRREIHELIMDLHRCYMEDRGDPYNILNIPFDSTPRRPPPPPLPCGPGSSHDNHNSNSGSQDHFLGKPDEAYTHSAGASSGAGFRDDDSSNSSAAWDHLKPVPSPPFPVALVRQSNSVFDGSSESPNLGLEEEESQMSYGEEQDCGSASQQSVVEGVESSHSVEDGCGGEVMQSGQGCPMEEDGEKFVASHNHQGSLLEGGPSGDAGDENMEGERKGDDNNVETEGVNEEKTEKDNNVDENTGNKNAEDHEKQIEDIKNNERGVNDDKADTKDEDSCENNKEKFGEESPSDVKNNPATGDENTNNHGL